MNVETELCRRLQTLLKGRLEGVETYGNWLPDEGAKGLETQEGARLDIHVGGRRHGGYSSPIIENAVTLELTMRLEEDETLDGTVAAHERIMGTLAEWQFDIAALKRDMTVEGLYEPVGFKIDDGGTLTIERETKTRTLTHQFTIKGRTA